MTEYVKVSGFKELLNELQVHEQKIRNKVIKKATRAGSNIVKREAKKNAPKRVKEWRGMKYDHEAGNLKKNIGVQRLRKQPSFIIRDRVGFKGNAWYGALVERGHKIVRNGKVIGQVAPHPILRPAFDNNVDKIISEMSRVMAFELEKLK